MALKIMILLCLCGPQVFAEGSPSAEKVAQIQHDAKQGDAASQASLADLYRYGKGVKMDYKEAFQWARKAADQGNAQGQHYLGICYTYEMGVKKDLVEAFKWFKESAVQGYIYGQYRVGLCYLTGDGVPINDDSGVEWLLKSAYKGDADSRYVLGVHYYNKALNEQKDFESIERTMERARDGSAYYSGKSIGHETYEEHQITSYGWLNVSAASGHEKAKAALERLTELMNPKLISEAQKWSAE
jgi:TPR repeat protein